MPDRERMARVMFDALIADPDGDYWMDIDATTNMGSVLIDGTVNLLKVADAVLAMLNAETPDA